MRFSFARRGLLPIELGKQWKIGLSFLLLAFDKVNKLLLAVHAQLRVERLAVAANSVRGEHEMFGNERNGDYLGAFR